MAFDGHVIAPELLTPMTIDVDASRDRDSVPPTRCR
jgi:hypothetical protein